MRKEITKNGISILWDDSNISDMFSTAYAVYALIFPNKQVYIGSCENLADRMINHCTHRNGKKKHTLDGIMNKYKTFTVYLVKTTSSIDEAKSFEKKVIRKYSRKIYNYLSCGCRLPFKSTVNRVLLNATLYCRN